MKPSKKKKFDIVQFFILNTEKIALVLVIPLAIFIAIQGTKYEPLSWQPDVLSKAADNANNTIKTSERKASDEGVEIITYDVKATWIKAKISSEYYRTDTPWLPSLFPEKNKRGAVNIFTVNDLKAQSGLGAVSVNPEVLAITTGKPANAAANPATTNDTNNRIGERWAVITGLIPVKQQLDLYVEKFSSSVLPDPMRDMPTYAFYDVERAEIIQGAAELQWQKLDIVPEYKKKSLLWTGSGVDPVDPNFLAPLSKFPMAFPLPPVTKVFGAEVAHPPFIPILTESQMGLLKEVEKINEKIRKTMFDVKPEDVLEGNPFGGSGRLDSGTNSGMNPGMGSGMSSSEGGANITRKRRTRPGEPEENEITPVKVDNYLFRFLDFNVVPGKSYRYRVRLYLANPNYMLAPNFLEDETLSKEPFLVTEYSNPSNTVTLPLESRVLATDVFPIDSKQPWADPAASIMAVHFDLEDGSEWYVEKPRVYRGSTINYKKLEATNPALEKQAVSSMDMGMSEPPGGGGGRAKKTSVKPTAKDTKPKEGQKQIDVVSDVCVLDIKGGEALYKLTTPAAQKAPDLKAPGKMMVLEPSGNLLIRTVNNDLQEVETVKNPKDAANGLNSGGYPGGSSEMRM